VELFEQIRREYEFGIGTIQGVAKKFGVHRRLVRDALRHALPPEPKPPQVRRWKLGSAMPFMDSILEQDRMVPRKQRHTAHRLWQRVCQEVPGVSISERAVRGYVRQRKREMGLLGRETCVPQSYAWGSEAQVDWYEALAILNGERTTLQVFCMRSMASGAAFHRAYTNATQQAFLEAHEQAFYYFGGVFHRLRYDNLKSAVQQVLRGKRREETTRFIAFRSHWRFASEFCNPAAGHEKGGVEGEVGYFRRNHWVPLPELKDLEELNGYLLACCQQDQRRQIDGAEQRVGAAWLTEQAHLLPLATESFDLIERSWGTVDGLGCVRVRTNQYSVPLAPGTKVEVHIRASHVELWHNGVCVAQHERCYRRRQQILDLEHYLDVLEKKPGALAGSTPLAQWRAAGRWPESFDVFWQALNQRHGRQEGTRRMIGLLQAGKRQGYNRLEKAITEALSFGSQDDAAVRHLLETGDLERPQPEALEIGALIRYEQPPPVVTNYDQLLSGRQA
jgi:transposase